MLSESRQTRDRAPEGLSTGSIVRDYRTAFVSRQASLAARREVLTGKAKFGIFGDGKEVAQVALARAFRRGDWRSGYYRDQTLMMALGLLSVEEFFAQLYADPDPSHEPWSAGRQMTAHFATHLLDDGGRWTRLVDRFNSSADVSPTASQMPRLLGLAYASKVYRTLPGLDEEEDLSRHGDEIAFGTIGNASCAEGLFWETVNAAGVLQVPMLLAIWDDEYGISVPNDLQITKSDLSATLRGFQREPGQSGGLDVYTVKGWDYPALCETYLSAARVVREEYVPAIVHVIEMTQPQGHSTSGSHERYKSAERLEWEREHDCLAWMRAWMIDQELVAGEELAELEARGVEECKDARQRAWERFRKPLEEQRNAVMEMIGVLASQAADAAGEVEEVARGLERLPTPGRRDLLASAKEALILARKASASSAFERLSEWHRGETAALRRRYATHLYSETDASALRVERVAPSFSEDSPEVRGFEVLNATFDAALSGIPELIAFGEDVGRLGDVNQGFAGLQDKHGADRVFDTGIREATILGQAIGMAMRGLRPLCEVQYLDYLLYALQIMSDDLATVRWRTRGRQKAPVIVRTRGHRLEGIWHSGSPMAGILHLVRGIWICVPRDMTQAAGMYNTLLRSDDPALVVEVLNGYRLKETLPDNVAEFTVPLGVPEVLREGSDVTLVTYGACCRVAVDAAELLARTGVDVEVIDVQTLLPFDRPQRVLASLKHTNRLVLLDEDVPGGTTAYMLRHVLEEQGGFDWLDAEPVCISASAHRPPYGSDGDYAAKPNRESVFEGVYALMHRSDPRRYPV